jgi:hypothetical protein
MIDAKCSVAEILDQFRRAGEQGRIFPFPTSTSEKWSKSSA